MLRFFSTQGKRTEFTRKFTPKDLPINVVSNPQLGSVRTLSNGLERVLFNQGVHFLCDSRTNVYNFDPFLKNVAQPESFDFDCVPKFVSASEDEALRQLGIANGSRYISSTSSMTAPMSHLYFLITRHKHLNISPFVSQSFHEEPRTHTILSRSPVSIILKHHPEGIRSVVTEKLTKADQEQNILSLLGQSMERLLTHSKEDFQRMLLTSARPLTKATPESYIYTSVFDIPSHPLGWSLPAPLPIGLP